MANLQNLVNMMAVFQKETGILISNMELKGKGDKQLQEEFGFDEVEYLSANGTIKSAYNLYDNKDVESLVQHKEAIAEGLKAIGIEDEFYLGLAKVELVGGIGFKRVDVEFDVSFRIGPSKLEEFYNNYARSIEQSKQQEQEQKQE